MRQRFDETKNFVAETFGKPSNGSMKNKNGLDEFDMAAIREGNSERKLNSLRCRRRLTMVRIN